MHGMAPLYYFRKKKKIKSIGVAGAAPSAANIRPQHQTTLTSYHALQHLLGSAWYWINIRGSQLSLTTEEDRTQLRKESLRYKQT
jgi:hypothetical protein